MELSSGSYVEGEILVKYKKTKINLDTSSGRTKATNFATAKSFEKVEDLEKNNISVLRIKDGKTVEQKIDELETLKTELIQNNIDLENQRKALTNVLEDVQNEKDTVASQAESLQKFEAASKQSNEMIVFTDSEGIVEWANKATEDITGFTNEETVGKKVGETHAHRVL
jgi:PAS domain-containing protein